MLDSFDTLTSHLLTTFTALSSAVARSTNPRRKANAFLAFLVGPSIGSARSKVVLGIDGLEVKVWGSREDASGPEFDGLESESEEGSDGASDVEDVPESDDEDVDRADEEEEGEEEPSSATPSQFRPIPPYADEQAFRIAERALSRALANADGEGHGMFAELGS
jgi:hypothetical protein